MATQRIKVAVADLLTRVRAARAEAVTDYEQSLAKYTLSQKRVRKAVVDALVSETKRLRGGGDPELDRSYSGKVTIELPTLFGEELPSNPGELNLRTYDRDISLLELSRDDSIIVTTDGNWSRYL